MTFHSKESVIKSENNTKPELVEKWKCSDNFVCCCKDGCDRSDSITSIVFLEQSDFYTQMDHVIAYIYQQVFLSIFHLLFCSGDYSVFWCLETKILKKKSSFQTHLYRIADLKLKYSVTESSDKYNRK